MMKYLTEHNDIKTIPVYLRKCAGCISTAAAAGLTDGKRSVSANYQGHEHTKLTSTMTQSMWQHIFL